MSALKRSMELIIRPNKFTNNLASFVSKTEFASAAAAAVQMPQNSHAPEPHAFVQLHHVKNMIQEQILGRPRIPHKKHSLVIFDKDGTLICFNSMWVPWTKAMIKRLRNVSGLDESLDRQVYELLGFCTRQGRVRAGLLAHGTMAQIRERIATMLIQNGINERRAREMVKMAVRDCDTSAPERLRQIHDLQTLFAELKWNGVKIAICTADSRVGTIGAIQMLNLENYVDFIMCGDDAGSMPKPNPHNALHICRMLGVKPEEAVMVGDTAADMHMGRMAKLGGTVGVLSGIADYHELRPHADHIVQHVGEIMDQILLADDDQRERRRQQQIDFTEISNPLFS